MTIDQFGGSRVVTSLSKRLGALYKIFGMITRVMVAEINELYERS
jgi:hypothetical protein